MSSIDYVPDDSALRAEVGRQAGLTHIAAQAPLLPLTELDPRHFEILCYHLLCKGAGSRTFYDQVSLLPAGADKARDILLRRGNVTGVVQCKRHARKLSQTTIATELLRFSLNAVRNPALLPQPGTVYQFWTASGLTESARQLLDSNDSESALRAMLPGLFDAARSRQVSLAAPSDDIARHAEENEAIAIASTMRLSHVGPEAITQMLHAAPAIRRQFFRSPEDGPIPAAVEEIDRLVDRHCNLDLKGLQAGGRLAHGSYVPRTGLSAAFAEFLEAPERLFSVIGGSGQGKTSWLAQLLAAPPSNFTPVLIPAERIAAGDRNPVDTLARLLSARDMEGVPPERLDQALWRWFDAGNRIVAVDGLDRAVSSVRETLPSWLDGAIDLTANVSVRLIITARREAWSHLSNQVPRLKSAAFASDHARGDISFPLQPLSPTEAARVYAAYGVTASQHRGARLHSPALISLFARLKAASAGTVVTRYDVLKREYETVVSEIAATGIGRLATMRALNWLGDQLLLEHDGWIKALPPSPDDEVLEVLLARDRLICNEAGLRLDVDDMAELLLSRRLDLDRAACELDGGREDPLFMGAVALLVARMEDEGGCDKALGHLLDEAPNGLSPRLDAAALAILELREPQAVEHRVRQAVGLYEDSNLLLMACNLGRLLVEIDLPGAKRFDLIRPLIKGEERDDWRSKYWRGNQAGRFVSSWAKAAELAMSEDPAGLLPAALELTGHHDALHQAIGEFLLYRIAQVLPEAALRASWEINAGTPGAILVAMRAAPLKAAAFLPKISLTSPRVEEFVVDRLWELFRADVEDGEGRKDVADTLHATAKRLLEIISDPSIRAILRVVELRTGDAPDARRELERIWDELPAHVFWHGIVALGPEAIDRIEELLQDTPTHLDREWVLSVMPSEVCDTIDPVSLLSILDAFIQRNPQNAVSAGDVVETMLYRYRATAFPLLDAMALRLASCPIDKARLKILFFAGSAIRNETDRTSSELARREQIVDVLVEHETGGTLHQLVWKLAESAHERARPHDHLRKLADRFGRDRIDEALMHHRYIPGVVALRSSLTSRHQDRP